MTRTTFKTVQAKQYEIIFYKTMGMHLMMLTSWIVITMEKITVTRKFAFIFELNKKNAVSSYVSVVSKGKPCIL